MVFGGEKHRGGKDWWLRSLAELAMTTFRLFLRPVEPS